MALPTASSERQLKHRRSIDVQVYVRGDGCWDVDARLIDVRPKETRLASGTRAPDEPIHEMLLRLVVDDAFGVRQAGSQTFAMPFPGQCDGFEDPYARLVGLNLMHGFRQGVRERLGGVLGCTHLTELTHVLPTAVVQALAEDAFDPNAAGTERPFPIDRCQAMRSDGPTVRTYFARWYRAPLTTDH